MVDLADKVAADELPASYRSTEFGVLPEDWSVARLGDVGRLVRGVTYRREDVRWLDDSSALPILRATNITPSGLEICEELVAVRRDLVKPDQYLQLADVVIAMSSGSKSVVGKAAPLTKEWLGSFGAFCGVFRPDAAVIDPAFAASVFQTDSYRRRIETVARGTNINNLSKEHVLGFEFPLPPLPEQRAIAHVLSTVQRASKATEAVIEAARELKRSLTRHVFTYGPVPVDQVGRAALKDTEIGPIPHHWIVRPLGELLRQPLRNGHSARESPSGHGVRTLTLSAVTNGDFSPKNTKITAADPERVRDLWLLPGDILVERANTRDLVGTAALYEGPPGFAIFPDLTVRVQADASYVLPRFLAEFLTSPPCRSYFRRSARGTAGNMPKIDHGTIEATRVLVPPLPEQAAVGMALRAADCKLAVEESRKRALGVLFRTVLHGLMTGEVRVVREE